MPNFDSLKQDNPCKTGLIEIKKLVDLFTIFLAKLKMSKLEIHSIGN